MNVYKNGFAFKDIDHNENFVLKSSISYLQNKHCPLDRGDAKLQYFVHLNNGEFIITTKGNFDELVALMFLE